MTARFVQYHPLPQPVVPVPETATSAVYALAEPGEGPVRLSDVRYVGQSVALHDRVNAHLRGSRTNKQPSCRWIASLLAKGQRPRVAELERVAVGDADEAERDWIAAARASGVRLLNVADGGGPTYEQMVAFRARLGLKTRQRKQPVQS